MTVRISTPQTYDRALDSMLKKQVQLSETQLKLSEGKSILKPSDDPVGAGIVENLTAQIETSGQFIKNAEFAETSLNVTESALDNVTTILGRIRELLVQGKNGTLTAIDRESISTEIESRYEELMGIANTQLADGTYLFSGFTSGVKPFTEDIAGAVSYNGDQGTRYIDVNTGVTVQSNFSGAAVFTDIKTGNNTFQTRADAGNSGSGVISKGSMIDSTAYSSLRMNISFENNGSGQLAYRVTDELGTVLVPAAPLTAPADSPSFHEGEDIIVNGVNFSISGMPQVGDQFVVEPSARQDVFTTVTNIVEGLTYGSDTDQQQAAQRNQLDNGLINLDRAMEHIDTQRAKLGAQLNVVDNEKSINESSVVQAKSARSLVEDLDYAEAITELNRRSVALQAAQQSFVKIENLSLFNFIN